MLLITDLGRDIDDTCALLALCASPELELVGVVTCGGNSVARAKVLPCFIYHLLLYIFVHTLVFSFFVMHHPVFVLSSLVLVSAFACLFIRWFVAGFVALALMMNRALWVWAMTQMDYQRKCAVVWYRKTSSLPTTTATTIFSREGGMD